MFVTAEVSPAQIDITQSTSRMTLKSLRRKNRVGKLPNNIFMSSTELMGTPAMPTSPRTLS
jgi:hypothetical protein